MTYITTVHIKMLLPAPHWIAPFEIRGEHAEPEKISRLASEHVYGLVTKTPDPETGRGHTMMVGVRGGPGGGELQIFDHTGPLGYGSYHYYDVDLPEVEDA